jgi:energy-coupling factor transport system permease protein
VEDGNKKMLAYQFKDNLIYKLHPLTSMIFVGVVFVLALIFSHPAFLLGLLIPVGDGGSPGGSSNAGS